MAKFTSDTFRAAFERAPQRLAQVFLPMLLRRARAFRQGILVKNRLSGRPGLFRRSGDLARSFKATPEGETTNLPLQGFTLVEYSTSPYAKTHELGATITPRNVQNLAIPIGEAKTATGVKRGGVRSFANTFVGTSKNGNRIVFQRGEQGKARPLFILKKNVVIPARLGFYEEWTKDQEARRADLARAAAIVLGEMK